MKTFVKLYSDKENEILSFLKSFYVGCFETEKISAKESTLEWKKEYDNPTQLADIIGAFIENDENFKINMWISLDEDVLINVTPLNADEIIRYLFERYPY